MLYLYSRVDFFPAVKHNTVMLIGKYYFIYPTIQGKG